MARFARHHRVLYVEPPPHLRPAARLMLHPRTAWQELRQPRVRRIQDGLYVYHSPALVPISGRFPVSALTHSVRRALLLQAMASLGMQRPIVWLSRPEMVDLVGLFHEQLTIYHVVDEYTAYQGVTEELARWLRKLEEQLLRRVDMVIVVSPALLEDKQPSNPHTYLVPNGVDLAAFECALSGVSAGPEDLLTIPEPRLVYAGLIGSRLDLALLLTLSQSRPDWSFVMIGQVDERGCQNELGNLRDLPNVHWLGVKPPSVVPGYLLACQVCLLPYRHSIESDHIDPLKLYEGLASGKPIVSTPIPAVLPYGHLVRLASTPGEYEAAISAALAEQDEEMAAKRRTAAAANTWDMRVEQLSDLIRIHLSQK